ncbi:MAG: hypothetical protein RLY16_173 [Bacteroidota bacterium]
MKKLLIGLLLLSGAVMSYGQKTAPKKAPAKKSVAPKEDIKLLKKRLSDLSTSSTEDCGNILILADKILKIQPSDTEAVVKKTVCLARSGAAKEAIAQIKSFYKSADDAVEVISVLPYIADLEFTQHDRMVYYDAAIEIAPNNGSGYFMKATELADMEKFDQALPLAEKGFSLLAASQKERLLSSYAFILATCGQSEKALSIALPVLKTDATDLQSLQTATAAYLKLTNYDAALQVLDKAIAIDSSERILRMKVDVLYEKKNLDDACTLADLIQRKFDGSTYLQKKMFCPNVVADVNPAHTVSYLYKVKFGGDEYDFKVSEAIVDMNAGISFHWEMNMNESMKGKVTISKDALTNAHQQMNRFSAGDHALTNQTTVWVSNEVFSQIKTSGFTKMNMNGEEKLFKVISAKEDRKAEESYQGEVLYKNEERVLKLIHLRSEDGKEDIWINDDAANPLITRMKSDWEISLASVESK